MSFSDDILALAIEIEHENASLLDRVSDVMLDSIVNGSTLTGAAGQPMAPDNVPNAGKLRDSWRKTAPDDNTREISTSVDYALEIEDNPRGLHFTRGGSHSVADTAGAFDVICEIEATKLRGVA